MIIQWKTQGLGSSPTSGKDMYYIPHTIFSSVQECKKYKIYTGQDGSNISNVLMQQENTKSPNKIANSVTSDKKIEHINSQI